MWPFNAHQPNDLTYSAPGLLTIFKEIQLGGSFPSKTRFGNSAEVMGEKIRGDADDFIVSTTGIPSVTAELGLSEDFIDEWTCKRPESCFSILTANSLWVEYILSNVDFIAKFVQIR